MNSPKVHFIIAGAMKCATSSIYEQLNHQPGIYLPSLKEPNFFSDDQQFLRGLDWYYGLFEGAKQGDITGEASTHYTKLPDYPNTISRMRKYLPNLKIIYIMRHPIDRLVSQYIHEWTENNISMDINSAIKKYPELINYSRYFYQLEPFIKTYGKKNIYPIFLENIKSNPQKCLEGLCDFIDYQYKPKWHDDDDRSNISSERIRKFPFYDLLVESELATFLRQNLIAKSVRVKIKQRFQMLTKPELTNANLLELERIFDDDLKKFCNISNYTLTCENFRDVVQKKEFKWL